MAKFPDLTGDGEVTQADVLKGRGVYKKGGKVMKHDHGHKPMAKMSHGGHYCWGGKVMKKAEGGPVKKYKTIEDIIEETKGIEVKETPRGKSTIPEMTPAEMRRVKATADDEERKRRYDEETEDMRENPMNKAKGGMAKGGKWIQSAIKKPGALKKSLGVPMGKPIPAKKLEKASKAPGKMGQRARLAMTLKGMK